MVGEMALTKKALIVVRTYPTPAKTGVEVSCTAAISDTGEWLRLFPIPYRYLEPDARFAKYQWVQVSVEKSKDDRPTTSSSRTPSRSCPSGYLRPISGGNGKPSCFRFASTVSAA